MSTHLYAGMELSGKVGPLFCKTTAYSTAEFGKVGEKSGVESKGWGGPQQ